MFPFTIRISKFTLLFIIYRLTLSDGVSSMTTLVMDKTFNTWNPNDWACIDKYIVISIKASHIEAREVSSGKQL